MPRLTRKDYDSLKKEIYREADRLNKQAERAVKNYGVTSPLYKEIEKNIVSLVQSTGTYITPYYRTSKGALKISMSENNMDKIAKSAIAKNTYVRQQIQSSKSVNITNLIYKYQTELTKSTGQQFLAKNLKERQQIVREYSKIKTISESNLWNIFGSEMGNAKKYGTDKQILTTLFDIQNAMNKQLELNDLGQIFDLWKKGTNVRKLSESELELIKNGEKQKDEEYESFIRD